MFTMAPPPLASMAGIWNFIPRKVPRMLVAMPRSNSSGSMSASGAGIGPAVALLNAASSRPPTPPARSSTDPRRDRARHASRNYSTSKRGPGLRPAIAHRPVGRRDGPAGGPADQAPRQRRRRPAGRHLTLGRAAADQLRPEDDRGRRVAVDQAEQQAGHLAADPLPGLPDRGQRGGGGDG